MCYFVDVIRMFFKMDVVVGRHFSPSPCHPPLLTCLPVCLPTHTAYLPCVQVRAADLGRRGGDRIDSNVLREVEHSDLMHYGLIPEFVGRLPVIVRLEVRDG